MKLEEKQSLLEILIVYFKNKENSLKIRFLEAFLNENIFRPYKFEDIFSLVEMFQYNFFDENYNVIFKNINKFVLVLKDEGTLKSTKSKLIDLYDNIMKVKDLNIIHKEIQVFLFLHVVKNQEKEKVLCIFSKNPENTIFPLNSSTPF